MHKLAKREPQDDDFEKGTAPHVIEGFSLVWLTDKNDQRSQNEPARRLFAASYGDDELR